MAPTALKVIAASDVQRICSGQSVVDLATAVKELVENALDAGASQIDVKLKDFGKEYIEVSDNGVGVAPTNYSNLVRKHYTSKIAQFEDLERLTSFGFRGEALSSICQLVSSFSVCTRTKDDAIGTLLVYDQTGEIISETKKARPVGTTVIAEDLFKPLAVRYKDFHRNIKKHYAKLLRVLQAYAVICCNVRFCFIHISGGKNTSRQVVMSTPGNQSVGDNVASVFGTKFFRSLIKMDVELAIDPGSVDEETGDANDNSNRPCRVVGFVSKTGAGVGRSDNDHQFLFINGRPIDLPKVTKALNEVWRQFEMKHKPACVLNFELPLGEYDVNVTPDKRQTFLKQEGALVEQFKMRLTELYEPSRNTFAIQPLMTRFTQVTASENAQDPNGTAVPSTEQRPEPDKEAGTSSDLNIDQHQTNQEQENDHLQASQDDSDSRSHRRSEPTNSFISSGVRVIFEEDPVCQTPSKEDSPLHTRLKNPERTASRQLSTTAEQTQQRCLSYQAPRESVTTPRQAKRMLNWTMDRILQQRDQAFPVNTHKCSQRKRLRVSAELSMIEEEPSSGGPVESSELTEARLQRVLKKEEFDHMEVIGQFNLGFIIGKLGDDLFIIDQHASDEKYNYEVLQHTTVLHQQPLVRPLPIELTASEELIVMEHLPVFAKHGITFAINQDAPSTKKLKLLSLPFSKHTQFGVEDVRELASLLMDCPRDPDSVCMPKVASMLASRACRSSIMIGTALRKEDMRKIVRHLSGLDQPWNCPHGRPTLRHLINLSH